MTREGPSIEIRATGAQVQVELPETPSSGYRWALERAPAGIEEQQSDYLEPAGGPVAGGSGVRTFQLHVPGQGIYELEFVLRRSWEPEPLERRRVTVIVLSQDG